MTLTMKKEAPVEFSANNRKWISRCSAYQIIESKALTHSIHPLLSLSLSSDAVPPGYSVLEVRESSGSTYVILNHKGLRHRLYRIG